MEQGPRLEMKREEVEISGGRTLYSYTFPDLASAPPEPAAAAAEGVTEPTPGES